MRVCSALLLCSLLPGCGSAAKQQVVAAPVAAAPPPVETVPARRAEESRLREEVVALSRRYVGLESIHQVNRGLPDDCTGFVRLVFDQLGIELMSDGLPRDNGVTAMWRSARKRGEVSRRALLPGDLVFFRETYDRNRDGRRNDGLTHVAIVEEVLDDGTVVFIHRGGQGVARSRFHPATPKLRYASDGRVLNDYLRSRSKKLRAYLAGELWAGAVSPEALR